MGRYWQMRRAGSNGPSAAAPDESLGPIVAEIGGTWDGIGHGMTASWTNIAAPPPDFLVELFVYPIVGVALEDANVAEEASPFEFITPPVPGGQYVFRASRDGYDSVDSAPFQPIA